MAVCGVTIVFVRLSATPILFNPISIEANFNLYPYLCFETVK